MIPAALAQAMHADSSMEALAAQHEHAPAVSAQKPATAPDKPAPGQAMPGMKMGGKDPKGTPTQDGMPGMKQGTPGMKMDGMGEMSMPGMYGPWSMAREASGTTWLPDDSPMFMKMLPKAGRYDLMLMGIFTLNYTDSNVSGGRGDRQFFSNSMPMLMARRDTGGGTIGLRLMGSLDPVFNGEYGYPNLFQTGETAYGNPLKDRQHPHDLISELALTYSRPLKGDTRGFLYLAPVGEPALGGAMYLMRPSGMENPEAPITHHWFDSTHISFGVVTGGVSFGDKLKVEGSAFNGREPDENRYSPDNLRLDSASTRVSFSPNRSLAFNVAYGYLHEPEPSTAPGQDQHRFTASAHYGKTRMNGDATALTLLYGRNIYPDQSATDAYLLEGALYRRDWSYYARYENVAKDELVDVPAGDYRINKLTFGATRDFAHGGGFDVGVGAYAGLYAFPSALKAEYGDFPVTFGVYLRIRPGRMKHDMGSMKDVPSMPGMDMKP